MWQSLAKWGWHRFNWITFQTNLRWFFILPIYSRSAQKLVFDLVHAAWISTERLYQMLTWSGLILLFHRDLFFLFCDSRLCWFDFLCSPPFSLSQFLTVKTLLLILTGFFSRRRFFLRLLAMNVFGVIYLTPRVYSEACSVMWMIHKTDWICSRVSTTLFSFFSTFSQFFKPSPKKAQAKREREGVGKEENVI